MLATAANQSVTGIRLYSECMPSYSCFNDELLQKLTQHVISQSKLNFGLAWFLYGPKMFANFH